MRKARVLVVEDDPELREMLARVLSRVGFEALGVADGREALDAVSRGEYDAIICDVRLPGMSGIQALQEIRKQQPHVRGIVITGYASETAPLEAIQAGVDGYFRKPFDLEELVRLLREKLDASRNLREQDQRMRNRETRYHRLLRALVERVGPEEARAVLSPVVEGDPEGVKLLSRLVVPGEAPKLSHPSDAERQCRSFLELGLVYADAGMDELALEALARAEPLLATLIDQELHAEILYWLGRLQVRSGEETGARQAVVQLEDLSHEDPGATGPRLPLLKVHVALQAVFENVSLDLKPVLSEIDRLLPGLRDASLHADEAELCLLAAAAAHRAGQAEQASRWLVRGAELLTQHALWPLFFRLLPTCLPLLVAAAGTREPPPALHPLLARIPDYGRAELAAALDLQDDETRKAVGRFLASIQRTAAGTLQIYTFGGVRIFRDGEWVGDREIKRRKIKYLLAHLLSRWPHPVPEETLLDTFWPDLSPARGRQALYNHVYLLRHLLEPTLTDGRKSRFVVKEFEQYRLVTDPPVWCDLLAFRRKLEQGRALIEGGDSSGATLPLMEAVRLYAGPFVSDCLDDWSEGVRRELERGCLWAVKLLAALWEREGAWDRAMEMSRKGLLIDPLDEEEHRRLMRGYLASGRPDHARRQFEVFRERLRLDLGVDPSPETLSLHREAGGAG